MARTFAELFAEAEKDPEYWKEYLKIEQEERAILRAQLAAADVIVRKVAAASGRLTAGMWKEIDAYVAAYPGKVKL